MTFYHRSNYSRAFSCVSHEFLETRGIETLGKYGKQVYSVPKCLLNVLRRVLKRACERRSGLMVSALDSGESGSGSSPSRVHCVVFLDNTLYSHADSPPPPRCMNG